MTAVTPPLYSTLEGLKRRAKQYRKETGCTHTQALNQLARLGGYKHYTDARDALQGGAA